MTTKTEKLFLLYYSGTVGYDLDDAWVENNANTFCGVCRRPKSRNRQVDIIMDGALRARSDMFSVGHLLVPGFISSKFKNALGREADDYLNFGKVYALEGSALNEQNAHTFTGKNEYINLRGRTPSIRDGLPIPDDDRLVICRECGFESRRERAPWFLLQEEHPNRPISCTEMGLILTSTAMTSLLNITLRSVVIQEIAIVNG